MKNEELTMNGSHVKYHGFTYPSFLDNKFVRRFWKKFICPRDIHLFDEVIGSTEGDVPGHYLGCDCCGIVVEIGRVMTEEETVQKINAFYDSLIDKAEDVKMEQDKNQP